MDYVKLDKRGKVLIPADIRKRLKLFDGQKFVINSYQGIIEITPYKYVCHWCGADIPEGDAGGSCKECSKKNTRIVY